jgi:hypothetical protein
VGTGAAEFPACSRHDPASALLRAPARFKHTGVGAAITLTGARIDPSGTFQIAAAPQWPVSLPSGAEQRVTVRLAAGAAPGDYAATLFVQASSCAEQPLHLHATVSPATDAGSGTPDAGAGSSAASAGGTGQAASGGGCSSTGAAPEVLGLLALAALRRRRSMPLRSCCVLP